MSLEINVAGKPSECEDPNLKRFEKENARAAFLAVACAGVTFVGVSIFGGVIVGTLAGSVAGFGSFAFFRYW